MAKDLLVNKQDNKFIKNSNVIVRAVTNECAGIMTQRLFNFAILSSLHKLNWNKQEKHKYMEYWLNDFCNYYGIQQHKLYDKVIHKKQDMTVIVKELENLTSLKFFVFIEKENKKVLVIDLDSQGNITLELQQDNTDIKKTMAKIIASSENVRKSIFLIKDLYEEKEKYLIGDLIYKINKNIFDSYDYVLIDYPPTVDELSLNYLLIS